MFQIVYDRQSLLENVTWLKKTIAVKRMGYVLNLNHLHNTYFNHESDCNLE